MLNIKKCEKVGSYLETQEVDTLLLNYKKTRWIFNSERIGKPDSLSTWYTVNELLEFLQKAKKNGADGIRLYFGAYPKDFKKKPEYAERQTIVLVATKSVPGENGSGIDKNIYINSGNGVQILAYNVGKACPPFCFGGIGEPFDFLENKILDTMFVNVS
jgi:hypothetical protein